jgi:hypothetical protein
MFVSEERVLAVSFAVASARLANLANLADGGWLREVSENVYQGGVEYLMRVGPVGAVPGASRLVRVRFAEPAYRRGEATAGLRWEATGMTGGLFPALDADIRLTATENQGVRVTLTGSYRPPLGALGARLDRLLLRTVATATIRTLLALAAAVLTGAPAEAGQEAQPWLPEPETEQQKSRAGDSESDAALSRSVNDDRR